MLKEFSFTFNQKLWVKINELLVNMPIIQIWLDNLLLVVLFMFNGRFNPVFCRSMQEIFWSPMKRDWLPNQKNLNLKESLESPKIFCQLYFLSRKLLIESWRKSTSIQYMNINKGYKRLQKNNENMYILNKWNNQQLSRTPQRTKITWNTSYKSHIGD